MFVPSSERVRQPRGHLVVSECKCWLFPEGGLLLVVLVMVSLVPVINAGIVIVSKKKKKKVTQSVTNKDAQIIKAINMSFILRVFWWKLKKERKREIKRSDLPQITSLNETSEWEAIKTQHLIKHPLE